jgi:hypothetical protein
VGSGFEITKVMEIRSVYSGEVVGQSRVRRTRRINKKQQKGWDYETREPHV